MKKNSKKKILLLLLVFALIGVVGYGVYAYYYAEGSITQTGTITINGFNVELYGQGLDYTFINGAIHDNLECEYDSGETFICRRSLDVYNRGGRNVTIEIGEVSADVSGSDNASIISAVANWQNSNINSITIPGNDEYESFEVVVEVEVPGYVEPSDGATQVTEPISGGELQVTTTYSITATEAQN